jgi:hypothetical protein
MLDATGTPSIRCAFLLAGEKSTPAFIPTPLFRAIFARTVSQPALKPSIADEQPGG